MQINVKEDQKGFLIPFYLEEMKEIKRMFIIKNKKAGDIRGNHAHKKDSQILFLLSGLCEIEYENKDKKGKHFLEFGIPYYSKPYEWLKINMLESDTVVLVLSKEEYDENEYIREYKEFLEFL